MMTPIGYCALVRLALFERMAEARQAPVDCLLSTNEKKVWAKCVTNKRKVEFLGGRFAAKLAASMCRIAAGSGLLKWTDMVICPMGNGVRSCRHADGLSHPISISHTKNYAVAVASLEAHQLAVDIEAKDRSFYSLTDMFRNVELTKINETHGMSLRWTIKEMYGKLTGVGIFGYTHKLQILSHANRLWLGVPRELSLDKPVVVTAGYIGDLAVSIGFARPCSWGGSLWDKE